MLVALNNTQSGLLTIGAIVIVALLLRRSMHAKLGTIEFTVSSIDRAVNHKAENEPTLAEDVIAVREEVARSTKLANARHMQNVDRIDRLTGTVADVGTKVDGLAVTVRRDRHAARNTVAALVASLDESVRHAFGRLRVEPDMGLDRVTFDDDGNTIVAPPPSDPPQEG